MNTAEIFLIAMTIIFSVPYLIWRLGRTDYFAPLVVVQIITGILLGPGILGRYFPDYYAFVFSPAVIQSLNGIAWWAVMLFVMIAGIELDLKKTWAYRRESSITAGLALGTPLLFGCIAAAVLLLDEGWMGPKAMTWQFVLGVGMACAVTALPILILLLPAACARQGAPPGGPVDRMPPRIMATAPAPDRDMILGRSAVLHLGVNVAAEWAAHMLVHGGRWRRCPVGRDLAVAEPGGPPGTTGSIPEP